MREYREAEAACDEYARECRELHTKVARLTGEVERLTRERDEARADAESSRLMMHAANAQPLQTAMAIADEAAKLAKDEIAEARASGRAEGLDEAADMLVRAAQADERNASYSSAPRLRERHSLLAENERVLATQVRAAASRAAKEGER